MTDQVKYLGHFICSNLRDDADMMRQCRQLYAQANMLKKNFSMCTNPVKQSLFKAYCYSMYTCQLWWNFTNVAYRKVKVAYNDCFRMLMGMPRYTSASTLFVRNNLFTFDGLLRHLTYRFIVRINHCENYLVNAITGSDVKYCSNIRTHWFKNLYVPRHEQLWLNDFYYK